MTAVAVSVALSPRCESTALLLFCCTGFPSRFWKSSHTHTAGSGSVLVGLVTISSHAHNYGLDNNLIQHYSDAPRSRCFRRPARRRRAASRSRSASSRSPRNLAFSARKLSRSRRASSRSRPLWRSCAPVSCCCSSRLWPWSGVGEAGRECSCSTAAGDGGRSSSVSLSLDGPRAAAASSRAFLAADFVRLCFLPPRGRCRRGSDGAGAGCGSVATGAAASIADTGGPRGGARGGGDEALGAAGGRAGACGAGGRAAPEAGDAVRARFAGGPTELFLLLGRAFVSPSRGKFTGRSFVSPSRLSSRARLS